MDRNWSFAAMSRDVRLMRALASDIPQFRETFKTHVADFGGVFCHALMEEFANFIMDALAKSKSGPDAPQWANALRTGLQHLEQAYAGPDPAVKQLIKESFLAHLWKAGEDLSELKIHMGPNLKKVLAELK
jgi:hypothetical protein